MNWFKKAADQKDADAQFGLALGFLNGTGIVANYGSAEYYLKLASEGGNINATYTLGVMYLNPKFNMIDYSKAIQLSIQLFRIAALKGHSKAQADLGYMYERGYATPEDFVKAYMWYNISAASGLDVAIKNKQMLEQRLIPEQIFVAQTMSRRCQNSKFTECEESGVKSFGSGFFVSPSGHILTNLDVFL